MHIPHIISVLSKHKHYITSNVSGCHRGPKRKLWAGVAACAAHFCKFC